MIPGTRSTHITQGEPQHAPTGSAVSTVTRLERSGGLSIQHTRSGGPTTTTRATASAGRNLKYKIPPRFAGECNIFEEWKYEMTAHHGLQDPSYNRLLRQSGQSQLPATKGQLETAAPSQAVAEQWIQLSNNLRYILVSACDGPSSTICRQNARGNSFETWRPLHLRHSIPLGAGSVGCLTRLLKPQLDEQNVEESITTWEFQLAKYEQDSHTLLPDAVKIAILLNETKGPLQQHLQLQAGYYRAASSSNRLQAITSGNSNNRGPAPMDIGATWYNNGKGNKGKRKGKGKYDKGKGYGGYGNQLQLQQLQRRKRQRAPGQQGYGRGKGYSDKGKRAPGQEGYGKGKGYSDKARGKGYKDNRDMAKASRATKE